MVYLFVSALGIGWLTGMSNSENVQVIIPSLLTVITSLMVLIAGAKAYGKAKEEDNKGVIGRILSSLGGNNPNVNLMPVAILVLGVALGSMAGIYQRTNNYFGPDSKYLSERYSNTYLSEKDISTRLFNLSFPLLDSSMKASGKQPPKQTLGGLFTSGVMECEELTTGTSEEVRLVMKRSVNEKIRKLERLILDDDTLHTILREVICE